MNREQAIKIRPIRFLRLQAERRVSTRGSWRTMRGSAVIFGKIVRNSLIGRQLEMRSNCQWSNLNINSSIIVYNQEENGQRNNKSLI